MLHHLRKDDNLLHNYDQIIREQLDLDIIEHVDLCVPKEVNQIHYLPHHGIIRQDKDTAKLRIVYDASARASPSQPSLNDCLYSGPSLNEQVMDVLMRFHCHRVALVSDAGKAFLMVSVEEKDRDCLRFLWTDDVNSDQPSLEVLRFTCVVFGVTASSFLLGGTIHHHLLKYDNEDPEFVRLTLKSLCVDDVDAGGHDVNEAFDLYVKSKLRFQEGGFSLHKWGSNSEELIRIIEENEKCDVKSNVCSSVIEEDQTFARYSIGNQESVSDERTVLGLSWDNKNDEFEFSFNNLIGLASELPVTKRSVLSVAGRIYDPLGVISPVVIPIKVLFQQICRRKGHWDQELDDDHALIWKKWISELRKAHEISLPPCYFISASESVYSAQLHAFSDGSKHAFASTIYLRFHSAEGISTSFVTSKTRVAPLDIKSIPRLELLGALILARLIARVRRTLGILLYLSEVYCWTDNTGVLYWIKGTNKEYKQFVENRFREIHKLTQPESWTYVPSSSNPADIPIRGMTAQELIDNDLWRYGPQWLSQPPEFCSKYETSSNLP